MGQRALARRGAGLLSRIAQGSERCIGGDVDGASGPWEPGVTR